MFDSQIDTMGIGELIGLGIETMIVSLCMKIMSVLTTVILYGRMIEIYLYVSVAPVPFATLSNREWGSIGSNYIKGLCALAFQGFFIMVCVAIYAVLVSSVGGCRKSSHSFVVGGRHIPLSYASAYLRQVPLQINLMLIRTHFKERREQPGLAVSAPAVMLWLYQSQCQKI